MWEGGRQDPPRLVRRCCYAVVRSRGEGGREGGRGGGGVVRKARGRRGRGAWQTVGEASSAVLCLALSGISKGEVTGERGKGRVKRRMW